MNKDEVAEILENCFGLEELARLCGVEAEVVAGWIRDRTIPAWRVGNLFFVPAGEVLAPVPEKETGEQLQRFLEM